MVNGIGAIANVQAVSGDKVVSKATQATQNDFQDTFNKALEELRIAEKVTIQDTNELLSGTSTDLHTSMINLEKADIALRLTMQIRNKVIDAYKEVMRMQF